MQYILNKQLEVLGNYDVVVVGGGISGFAAAVAAKRSGAQVAVLEDSGMLGGMATLGHVGVFMPVGNDMGIYHELLSGFMDRKRILDPSTNGITFDCCRLRAYLSHMLAEEKIDVFYHCKFADAFVENGAVQAVAVLTVEGLKAVVGKVFIDCTGNGSLAIAAGEEYFSGREQDGNTQAMTLMFEMTKTGSKAENLPDYYRKIKCVKDTPQGRAVIFSIGNGRILVNMTRVRGNGGKIADLNHAETELLKQVYPVADFLNDNGCDGYEVTSIASVAGVRESNQIVCKNKLTAEDVRTGRKYRDVVAQSRYCVDIHSPTGDKSTEKFDVGYYDIPYGCMVPLKNSNMLVCGRAICADHTAISSARVMPTCMATGQAAGTAAALAVRDSIRMEEVSIDSLHAQLKMQGVVFD